jgi:transcriptional regulator of acetoin/glycerol metabolism
MTLRAAEKALILATLEQTGGVMLEAARVLGIDRTTLYAKVRRHGIVRERGPDGREG